MQISSAPDSFDSILPGLACLASPILIVDRSLQIQALNPAAENAFSISRNQLLHKSLQTWLGDVADLISAARAILDGQWENVRRNVVIIVAGDPLNFDCSISRLEHDAPYLLFEFWPLDAQLQIAREERLYEQQKVSRELIRNLAHEIKNPLGGIRGSAQLLENELPSEELREYTQVIITEVDRLQALLHRLLDGQRRIKPALLDIHDVLAHVNRLVVAEFAQIIWQSDYDVSLPSLSADREQLIQVFLNIIRNAAQALQGVGTVLVRTRIKRNTTWAKKLHRLALEIQIIDNGPGIPASLRDKIFYPLVSGRPDGSGLGLSIAQDFVEQHHGTLTVTSEPGNTCFSVVFALKE